MDLVNWGRLANMAVIAAGVFVVALLLNSYAEPLLPEWLRYGLLLASVLPFWWLGQQAEQRIGRAIEKRVPPRD